MDEESEISNSESQFEQMDRMYRHQRFFYDLTRKYYLLGRDLLIRDMEIRPGDRVLELGCGTARNLIALAGKHPSAEFFGLDASAEMLKTASSKVERAGCGNIDLRVALADQFDYDSTFGLDRQFDCCFFSYAVSIIPPWKESIDNAWRNLRNGGKLYIVDFYDQKDLPVWFGEMLRAWLRKFHVAYPDGLIGHLKGLNGADIDVVPIFRRYAVLITVTKDGS